MSRPHIPEFINRAVRKKCGFGCVICGCPIYQRHHIDDYAKTGNDDPDNLVLLCGTCHDEKTKGLISTDTILLAIIECQERERTTPHPIRMDNFKVLLGNNEMLISNPGVIFNILGRHYLKVSYDGGYIIDCCICSPDGRIALLIENNEYSFSTDIWDISYVGKTISFRSKLGDKFLQFTMDAEADTIIIRGHLPLNDGTRLDLTDSGMKHCGKVLANRCRCTIAHCGLLVVNADNDIYGIKSGLLNGMLSGVIVYSHEVGFVWSMEYLNFLKSVK